MRLIPAHSQQFRDVSPSSDCRSVLVVRWALSRAQRDVQVVYAFDFRLSIQIHPLVTGAKHSSYRPGKALSFHVSMSVSGSVPARAAERHVFRQRHLHPSVTVRFILAACCIFRPLPACFVSPLPQLEYFV
jgi:hypothetical protein